MASAHDGHRASEISIPARVWDRVVAVMERLASSRDLDEVLGLIIDSMRDCLGADRATVFQYDPGTHELFATRAHGVDRSLRFSADLGLAGEAARTKQIVNVPDCYADPRFNRDVDRQTGYHTRCLLAVPLVSFDGGLEGVAQVLNRADEGAPAFGPFDETIARALASQAAIAMRRARLLEAERRKNKMEADLSVAREMQLATFPAALPLIPGFDIAASNRQADETGGDTFDVVGLGDNGGGRGALLLMADATGHGIGPALAATQVQAMLRMAARLGTPVEHAATHLNTLMCDALPVGRFVTAFIGTLAGPGDGRNGAVGTVRYVAAGQAPVVVVRADGSYEARDATILPLGVDPWPEPPKPETVTLEPGDALVLLSDGYYEHMNHAQRPFGVERAVAAVREALTRHRGAEGVAAAVIASVDAALAAYAAGCGGGAPQDDQTALIVVRRA